VRKIVNKIRLGIETPYWNLEDEMVGMEKQVYLLDDKILKNKVLSEAHESKLAVHPYGTKMYCDLKDFYW
jgi:hypothetical protein